MNTKLLYAPHVDGRRDILFVSAFKDIGRDKWAISPRSVGQYISNFLNLAHTITYRLIVFVEPAIEDALRTHSLPANIELRKSADVTTFYDMYIDNETRMMGSDEYRTKIPEDRRQAPEHWCPAYTLINHAKVNYVKHVKDNYPGYTYYAWIDFGCIQRLDNIPRNINISKLTDKVTYLALREPPAVAIDANDMLRSHDIYITGANVIVHHSRVDEFANMYCAKLEEWKDRCICDDDQNLVLQLYFDNPGRFQLFYSNEWTSLYRNHLNRV